MKFPSPTVKLRSPMGLFVTGVVVTIFLAVVVAIALLLHDGQNALEANAPLVAAVIALGGVGTAQMVSISLDHNRAQDEALKEYLAEMSKLLLDKCLHKKRADYDAARVTARLQTLAVLERLDAGRKRTVLLFLREAQLIHRNVRFDPTITTTEPKVLFYAHYVGLREADLSGADLRKAELISSSRQHPVSLRGANLKGAKLHKATLRGADLSEAHLQGADLSEADLSEADRSGVTGATKEKLEYEADLSGADLSGADLSGADLTGANLTDVNLTGTNLMLVDLSRANLIGAFKVDGNEDRRLVTHPELEEQAKTLNGAIMPDGQEHEE